MKSPFLKEATARGFINQCTDLDTLDQNLIDGRVVAYAGFDPTAPSLHVGHLVQVMFLRLLQKHGHKPIVLLGGATAEIGDPSFKNEMRKMLSKEDITQNIQRIQSVFSMFLNFGDNATDAVMLNNLEWFQSVGYLEFLRTYGPHFSINRMLTFDTVKTRLEKNLPLSFLEFNYMLLQAYDFYHLHQTYHCTLQIGGSDQWGNIVNGVDLMRRLSRQAGFGLTTPLLTTASGAKMGKTEKGAVWLNRELLPDYDFWQFWRNVQDADVIKLMRLFTDIPLEEINRLESFQGAELNEAKKVLADHVTALVRGQESLTLIHETAKKVFESKESAFEILEEDSKGNPVLQTSLPVVDLPYDEFEKMSAFEIFVKAGLASSNGEARRLIRNRGGRIDENIIEDENFCVPIPLKRVIKISVGKKRHVLGRIIK